jgi:hypothetical protein
MLHLQPFLSHAELAREINDPTVDTEDALVDWLDGAAYYWITPDEAQSHNFKTLPPIVRTFLKAQVQAGVLPPRFAIYFDK